MSQNYKSSPRDFVIRLIEEGVLDSFDVVQAAVLALSEDDMRQIIQEHEWSGFDEDPLQD